MRINEHFGFLFFLNVFIAFQIDLTFSSLVDLTNKHDFAVYFITGKGISGLFLIFVLALIIFLAFQGRKSYKSQKSYWNFIKEELPQKTNLFGFFLQEITLARDLIVPIIVVAFY